MNCANHPDRERIAFCQNCGKPLCQECTRVVGSAVFCEPCLAAKLAGAGAVPPGGGSYAYTDPAIGAYAPVPPPPPGMFSGTPSPVLAGLLGFIPGVGAMYNEQYAKGIVHLVVFAILVSLADSHDIFGLFIAGWEFYMAIEAHHTARARRDGLPLPNPFGLNDLGERLGFGKSWGTSNTTGPVPADPYTAPYTAPFGSTPAGAPPADFVPQYAPPYTPSAVPPNWGTPPPPAWEQYAPPVPPPVPLDSQVPYPGNRFPAGALWLIGLGALFLITNAGLFHGFSGRLFVPALLIGLAVFIFVRKMTSLGGGLSDDGTPGYRWRLFSAIRSSAWLALVGLLFFLDEFHILTWSHSWPLFIIAAGLMTIFRGSAYSSAAAAAAVPPYTPGYGYPAPPAAPAAYTAPVAPTTSIVPTHDQEGS